MGGAHGVDDMLTMQDGVWVALIVGITESIKRMFHIPERFIPIIPVLVSVPVGFASAAMDPALDDVTLIRVGISRAVWFAGLAMGSYKVARTTIAGHV